MAVPAGGKIVVHLSWSIMLSSIHAKDRAIKLEDQIAEPGWKTEIKEMCIAQNFWIS
jgi:hypothetical protein